MKLEFVELDEVLAIHAESIRRFGGATLNVVEGRAAKSDVAVFFSEHAEPWD